MCKREKIAIFIIIVIAVMMQCVSVAQTKRQVLDQARELVEQKSYTQALEKYEHINEWLRKDPDLFIEWARVYTYANAHPGAIELFEQIRKAYPSHERQILRELADQYTWDGRLEEGIEIYRRSLCLEPELFDSRFGLARALTWAGFYHQALQEYNLLLSASPDSLRLLNAKAYCLSLQDRLEEAYQLYQRVLAKEPDNLDALNGKARIRVWQGYHRVGAVLYEDILVRHPRDIDAFEGLAFARHWDGRDDLAVTILDKLFSLDPDRQEAKKLSYRVKSAQRPYISGFTGYWKDKNKLSVQTRGLRWGYRPDISMSLEGIYQFQRIRQEKNRSINAERGGAGISKRLTDLLNIHSFLFGTHFDASNSTVFTTNTWLEFKPDDIWSIYMGYDRETFEDVGSIMNHIITDSGSISVDYRPNRFWFLSGKFKSSYYSDENKQHSVLARLEYRIAHKPFTKLYYNYYFSDWTKQTNNGYFNPEEFHSHSAGLYMSMDITDRIFLELQASFGHEQQHPTGSNPTYFLAAGLNWLLADNWRLSLRPEYFEARPGGGGDGYRRALVFLSLTYNFGAPATEEIFNASRSSRPAGGH